MDRAEQAFEEEKTRKAAALERASRASAENRAVVFPFGINHVSLPFCGSIETSKPAPKKAESAPGPSIFWADLAADDTSSDEEEEGEFGGSALHQAALVSSLSQVLALLRRGAKVNRCDPFRETALHMAARVGSLEICAALCAARADPTVRNKDNNSALDVANFSQQQNICHLLQDLS
ncbi:ANKDD1B [Symbiodinium sp. CCMP2592]|nr:ANKDD1B [Symbiodinium sp. CCMP2592]